MYLFLKNYLSNKLQGWDRACRFLGFLQQGATPTQTGTNQHNAETCLDRCRLWKAKTETASSLAKPQEYICKADISVYAYSRTYVYVCM